MARSPQRRRKPSVRRSQARRGHGARAALAKASARPWLAAAVVLLLALLPPTRALGAAAWGHVSDALASVRAADARARQVEAYARRYGISVELADAIERAARAEGLETELAFRLVRVESAFRPDAESWAGALGLTQVMPATADFLQPGITRQQLLDRDTNLRLGFRYLQELLAVYDGDEQEALTAYNRGPGTVARIRKRGGDPANGYADLVLGARGGSPVNLVRHDSSDAAPPAPPAHELPPARLPSGL